MSKLYWHVHIEIAKSEAYSSFFSELLSFKSIWPSLSKVRAECGLMLPTQIKRQHMSRSSSCTAACKGFCCPSQEWLFQLMPVCKSNILANSYQLCEAEGFMIIHTRAVSPWLSVWCISFWKQGIKRQNISRLQRLDVKCRTFSPQKFQYQRCVLMSFSPNRYSTTSMWFLKTASPIDWCVGLPSIDCCSNQNSRSNSPLSSALCWALFINHLTMGIQPALAATHKSSFPQCSWTNLYDTYSTRSNTRSQL